MCLCVVTGSGCSCVEWLAALQVALQLASVGRFFALALREALDCVEAFVDVPLAVVLDAGHALDVDVERLEAPLTQRQEHSLWQDYSQDW